MELHARGTGVQFLALLNELLLGSIGEAAHGRHLAVLAFIVGKVILPVALGQVFEILELLVRDGLSAPRTRSTFDATVQLHSSVHTLQYARLLDFRE